MGVVPRVLPWLVLTIGGALLSGLLLTPAHAAARSGLRVYVGYMDTHTEATSGRQPRPWPFRKPGRFVGSPCGNFGKSTTCWDAAAVRLDNPAHHRVRVRVVVVVGTHTYDLWGRRTVQPRSRLVLTETGGQNSENFDLSDAPPNAYNGGDTASCTNSGAVPRVRLRFGGRLRVYHDTGQVLNTGGVDAGHCRNGHFVADRRDESHRWVRIG